MNPIFLHIEYLLRTHDCVIIPSIGAFIISRRPAHLDRETGIITAPSASVTFNPSVTNNDGLIANSIARRAGIDYDTAVEILDEEVARLRTDLAARHTIEIGTIGTLTMGTEHNLLFTPAEPMADMSAALGLLPIQLGRTRVAQQQPEPAGEKTDCTESVGSARRFRPDKYYYIPIHKVFARIASMFVLVTVIAISFMVYAPTVDDTPRRDCASVIPVAIEQTSPAPVPAPAPARQTVKAVADTVKQYHVVVGTFTDPDEAARFMSRHSSDGYALQTVHGRRYIRVTADRSTDREAMVAVLRSARLDSCFRNAWIWKD